jgi:hypothetical protein
MTEQISINLSSDISYVYGTVNGEVADFSLTSPNTWTAIVPKSPDGKYVIEITAYNNLGTPTQYDTIIYRLEEIIEPRTNWTADDYYNFDDMNRVEANTQYVAEFLNSLSYRIPDLVVETGRDMTDIDFIPSVNRVEQNIEKIRNRFLTPPGYKVTKVWALGMGFDYRDANRLEGNLKLLYEWAIIAKDNQIYCGTFACGEEGVIY